MSIFVFSRPVHSGKTTELLNWCSQHQNITGVLMPDINGSRKIIDLQTKNTFDIECTDPAYKKELLTVVGRFNFYTAAFEKANKIIINALTHKNDWLLIDEAGKLELEGKGFYNAIVKAIEFHQHNTTGGNLLITVRDSLCEEVISFFNLNNPRIILQLDQLA